METEPIISSVPISKNELIDVVKIGKNGETAHRPDGKFVSNYELGQIDAHKDQIRGGLETLSAGYPETEIRRDVEQKFTAEIPPADARFQIGQEVKMSRDGKTAEGGWVVDAYLRRNREGLKDPSGRDVYWAVSKKSSDGTGTIEIHESELSRYQGLEVKSEEASDDARYYAVQDSMEDSYKGRLDKEIEADPKLLQILMVAEAIAEAKATGVEPNTINDKENRLRNLALEWARGSNNSLKQDIVDRLAGVAGVKLEQIASETARRAKTPETRRPERLRDRSWAEIIDLVGGTDLPQDVRDQLVRTIRDSSEYQTEQAVIFERAHETALKINGLLDELADIDQQEERLINELNQTVAQREDVERRLGELSAELPDVEIDEGSEIPAEPTARIRSRARRIITRSAQAIGKPLIALKKKFRLPGKKNEESIEQYEKRVNKRTTIIGLGLLAIGLAGGYAINEAISDGNGGGKSIEDIAGPTADNVDKVDEEVNEEAPPADALPGPADIPEFSPEAYTADPGEGWYQTFKDMGVPEAEWSNLLSKAGPKLQDAGWAYWDAGHNNWGINRPGALPQDVLELINNSR